MQNSIIPDRVAQAAKLKLRGAHTLTKSQESSVKNIYGIL